MPRLGELAKCVISFSFIFKIISLYLKSKAHANWQFSLECALHAQDGGDADTSNAVNITASESVSLRINFI